jgi:UDP-glucose 4-epimerase
MVSGSILYSKRKEVVMRALVTGGAGLVGSEIVDTLLASGHEVVSLDNYIAGKHENLAQALNNPNFTAVEGDICDTELLDRLIGTGFEVIFHEAVSKNTVCLIDPNKDLEVNAGGTLNLLIAARKHGVSRFIHASTGSVYGPTKIYPTDEYHPKDPASFYGVSKLAAESYVSLFNKFYGLPTIILRYFHVYGSRQDSSDFGGVVPLFIRKILNGETVDVTGDGKQIRAFTHVSDIARINYLASQNDDAVGKIFNCASDEKVSILSLAEKIIEQAGNSKSRINFVPDRIGDIRHFDVSNAKLKRELDFTFAVSFEEGLTRTIDEIRNN